MCAESMTTPKSDTCYGDSDSILTLKDRTAKSYAVGKTSTGKGCGKEGYPGVYTKISSYQKWIKNNTGLEIVEVVEEPVVETPSTEQPTTTTNTSSSNKSGGGSVGILMLFGLVGLSVMRSRQQFTAK